MKILFLSDGIYPNYVNGVSIYLHYFLRELHSLGIACGLAHVLNSRLFGNPTLQQTTLDGIRHFGIKNAPLFMGDSLENPLGNLTQPNLERLFDKILKLEQPDLLHIHELHRMPAAVMRIARQKSIPVIVTVHDYWFICPLFQLFTPQETICSGPDHGRNCVVTCLAGDWLTRAYRRTVRLSKDTLLEKILKKARTGYKKIKKDALWQTSRGRSVKKNYNNLKLKAKTAKLGRRQFELNQLLNTVETIHCVSTAAARTFVQHGLDENKIDVQQLGVKAIDWIEFKQRKMHRPPLRLAFLGHLGPSKGIQIVLEAVQQFPKDLVQLHIYGKAYPEDLLYVQQAAAASKNIFYHGPYQYRNLQSVFDSMHALVIPSIWNETLGMIGLEAQAAGVPVIASKLGGMTDYVTEGVNGLFFRPGDVEQLVELIHKIFEDPSLIASLSANAIRPDDISNHARYMVQLYEKTIAK